MKHNVASNYLKFRKHLTWLYVFTKWSIRCSKLSVTLKHLTNHHFYLLFLYKWFFFRYKETKVRLHCHKQVGMFKAYKKLTTFSCTAIVFTRRNLTRPNRYPKTIRNFHLSENQEVLLIDTTNPLSTSPTENKK